MSIQMNEEGAVEPHKGGEEAGNNGLSFKLKEIENELKEMSDIFPKIKSWEKSVMQQLCVMEQELDNEVKSSVLLMNLEKIRDCFSKLRSSISAVDDLSSKPEEEEEDHRRHHTVSKEWASLGIESEILKGEGMASFAVLFQRERYVLVKMCLFCLSIFPENVTINKRVVIYWWIGEGIIRTSHDKKAEEVGEEVVQHLLNRGFIMPRSKNSFIVDPWIRRSLLCLAERNKFLTLGSQFMPCNGQRRVWLWKEEKESYDGEREENVRSVFNVNVQYLGTNPEWLKKLQKVEVLHMGRWQHSVSHHIEVENKMVFNDLGSQKHLKYLSLRGISRIETLPPSIANLVSLKILDLRACHSLEKLPVGISELKNLTHLDVSDCYLLESMPKGLDRLHKLQVLKGFVMGKGGRNTCKISDLAGLKHLWKLSIRVGETQKDDHLETTLTNFSALRVLTIIWGSISIPQATSVSLPQRLTKLDLRCVPFQGVPDWLRPSKLPDLKKLYIRGGKLRSLEHNDGQIWKVKYLRLKYLKELEMDQEKLVALFPESQYLEKINCKDSDIKLKRRR